MLLEELGLETLEALWLVLLEEVDALVCLELFEELEVAGWLEAAEREFDYPDKRHSQDWSLQDWCITEEVEAIACW